MRSSSYINKTYIIKLGSLAALDLYYSGRAAGRAAGWPSYLKIRLSQPNFVELGLRLSLAKLTTLVFIKYLSNTIL